MRLGARSNFRHQIVKLVATTATGIGTSSGEMRQHS